MICEKCKTNQANTFIKKIVNGEYSEYHLCSVCASEMNEKADLIELPFDFSSLFNGLFGNALPQKAGTKRCELCGSTFAEITKSGLVGCAECYTTFHGELLPLLKSIHGSTSHIGKKNKTNNAEKAPANYSGSEKIAELKKQLEKAIAEQNFEQAAVLRDEIKAEEARKNEQ